MLLWETDGEDIWKQAREDLLTAHGCTREQRIAALRQQLLSKSTPVAQVLPAPSISGPTPVPQSCAPDFFPPLPVRSLLNP
jgi:hypothetical protein